MLNMEGFPPPPPNNMIVEEKYSTTFSLKDSF